MIGELLSAGVGILGAIFGGKKKETTTSSVDYAKMVRDATAAGFNPLTAIRNGGSAGFSTQTTTAPAMSPWAAVAQGVQGFLATNPFDTATKRNEQMLFDAQLEGLRLDNDLKRRSAFRTPVKKGDQAFVAGPKMGKKTGYSPLGDNVGISTRLGDPVPFVEGRNITVSNPYANAKVNPNFADAEAMETRYGDLVQGAYGVGLLAADAWSNAPISVRNPQYKSLSGLGGAMKKDLNTKLATSRLAAAMKKRKTMDVYQRSKGRNGYM